VEVGGAAVRRDAQCDRLLVVVVVVVAVLGLGVVIAVLVMIAMLVVMVTVTVIMPVLVRASPGHQVGMDVRMIAARVAMDHDAVRRDDHGGSEDRRQHRGEAGRHPFP